MHFCYKGIMYVNVLSINITLILSFAVHVYAMGKFAFNSHFFCKKEKKNMPVILFQYVNSVTVGPNAYKLFSYKKRVCCLLKKYIQFLNL